ncbi:hypothetical protein NLI96_g3022 [Meripilus lineatus]|uniref:Deacetylase sirtuin-type domain-containing protein n=1 Tax=Meripilus lineatus TaxID=2056292 RepID=A0AAD5V7H9_9APHY|nr:hypothetical protein NLI96_g3022 [Physisporinus lineatus]
MVVTLDLETYQSDSSSRRALSSLSLAVAKCKKIVVVTGAGISCSCGIPDFRSSDGLYALVKQQYPDVVLKGRDLFDASLFRDPTSTSVFYTFISKLKESIDSASPSSTHNFLKTLDSKQRLLRSYTQNIDGLEERVGLLSSSSEGAKSKGKGKSKLRVKDVRSVQLHGDIHLVRCTLCSAEFSYTEEYMNMFNEGVAPSCPECVSRSEARVARSARRLVVGTLRPAIVLYNEAHPLGDDIGAIQSVDITRKPDMLIIMGTSLKVHGFKKLVKDFAKAVHDSSSPVTPSKTRPPKPWAGKVIFVNKTAPGSEWNGIIDYHVQGETDEWVEKVVEDWKRMRPSDWEIQTTLLDTGAEHAKGTLQVAKGTPNAISAKGKHKAKSSLCRENNQIFGSTVDPFLSPLTPLSAPCSPSKRRMSESHYSTGEGSPTKKRAPRRIEKNLEFEERGLLFQDSTNTKASAKDDLCLADISLEEIPMAKKARGFRAGQREKPEVVINVRTKARKIPGRGRVSIA